VKDLTNFTDDKQTNEHQTNRRISPLRKAPHLRAGLKAAPQCNVNVKSSIKDEILHVIYKKRDWDGSRLSGNLFQAAGPTK